MRVYLRPSAYSKHDSLGFKTLFPNQNLYKNLDTFFDAIFFRPNETDASFELAHSINYCLGKAAFTTTEQFSMSYNGEGLQANHSLLIFGFDVANSELS